MSHQPELDLGLPPSGFESLAALARTDAAMLRLARVAAEDYARENGNVTTDDVRFLLNLPPGSQNENNWMGGIFPNGGMFRPTGEIRKSRIPTNHKAMIQVWELNT